MCIRRTVRATKRQRGSGPESTPSSCILRASMLSRTVMINNRRIDISAGFGCHIQSFYPAIRHRRADQELSFRGFIKTWSVGYARTRSADVGVAPFAWRGTAGAFRGSVMQGVCGSSIGGSRRAVSSFLGSVSYIAWSRSYGSPVCESLLPRCDTMQCSCRRNWHSSSL